jgi:hypothetical protein
VILGIVFGRRFVQTFSERLHFFVLEAISLVGFIFPGVLLVKGLTYAGHFSETLAVVASQLSDFSFNWFPTSFVLTVFYLRNKAEKKREADG